MDMHKLESLLKTQAVVQSPLGHESCKKNPLTAVVDCMNESASESCTSVPSMTGGKDVVPALLLELVSVAYKISKMDQMLHLIDKSGPIDSPEAAKFHELSMQGVAHSRKVLHAQQATLLKLLSSATGANSTASVASESAVKTSGMLLNEGKSTSKLKRSDEEETQSQCSTTISGESTPTSAVMQNTTDSDEDGSVSLFEKPQDLDGIQSLRMDLEKLKEYPIGCSLMVKKIKNLGFDSATALRDHFSSYGTVVDVLVSHSITKPSAKRKKGRVRPAAVGFVVLAALGDVKKVLGAGAEHMINGVSTEVLQFQCQDAN